MPDEKIVDKIRKLLRLSKSTDPNEAAVAAAQAARLMTKHGIESVDEESPKEVQDNADLYVEIGRRRRPLMWKWSLAWIVGEHGNCKPYTLHRKMPILDDDGREVGVEILGLLIAFIGRREDAEVCCYLYEYLLGELKRIHDERRPKVGRTIRQYIPGAPPNIIEVDRKYQRWWSRDFYNGAIAMIQQRMLMARQDEIDRARQEEWERNQAAPFHGDVEVKRVETALVLLSQVSEQVDQVAADMGLEYAPAKDPVLLSPDGFSAGVEAGREVSLSTPQDAPALPGVKKP